MIENRPYIYHSQTVSLCEQCLQRVEAKIVIENNEVWMQKWCPSHGPRNVLIATDAAYWRMAREVYIKAPEMPQRFGSERHWGCPYDCGLCTDHMQHSCLTILEVTEDCNLSCPVCYSASGTGNGRHRSLEEIETMLDAITANEGEPDVVQISGGEPTLHPGIFEILDAARRRPIRHLMLNTNGLRIAHDKDFAMALRRYSPGFEIYLQFDSLRAEPLQRLRGRDLREVHRRALDHLNAAGISTTLVMTVAKGVNDDEMGSLIEFAAKQPCVRGVTLQPVQSAGRTEGIDERARLTLTEIRQKILDQTALFSPGDIIPVPCNPDALAMGYALKSGETIHPLTRYIGAETLLAGRRNTIAFESDPDLRQHVLKLFSTSRGPEGQASCLSSLMCCLPNLLAPESITYANVFRVLIMSFLDAENFDVRAMKKSCVHIVQPDGRSIPFETFNLLYRNRTDLLQSRRQEIDRLAGRPPFHAETAVPSTEDR